MLVRKLPDSETEFVDAAPLVCVAIIAHVSQINVLLIAMVIIAFWYYVAYLTTGI